jgi:hypothetical protein
MTLLSYAKLPMLAQEEPVCNLSIQYDIYGGEAFLPVNRFRHSYTRKVENKVFSSTWAC